MTAPQSAFDPRWLAGLDTLAEQSIGLSEPNPRVACRIIAPDGRAFEGHTQRAGGPHAEIVALRAAAAAGADLRGGSAVVTLEPCSHHGRTPPCCDALIEAGLARVLVALRDPNPLVSGRGIERLRAAGITVELLAPEHPLAAATRALNVGFLSRMERGRPWVRLKIAASLDGITALANGASQWITGAAARRDGHLWRKRAGAVLSGSGTVLADDPRLDVRLVPTEVQPVRLLLDSQLRVPAAARVLQPPGQVWVYHTPAQPTDAAALRARRTALEAAGARVQEIVAAANAPCAAPIAASCTAASASSYTACHNTSPHHPPSTRPRIDLTALLRDLAAREINELHVEAGQRLNGAWLQAGLADELLLYLAPTLLGQGGAGLAQIGPLSALTQGVALAYTEVSPLGPDLRIRARVLAPQAPAQRPPPPTA